MTPPINHIQLPPKVQPGDQARVELKFKTGDILKGTVLRRYPGGEVLLSSRGRQFLAQTALDLREGQKHRFQVISPGPKIELKVLEENPLGLRNALHLWAATRQGRGKLSETLLRLTSSEHLRNLNPSSAQALKRLSQLLPAVIYGRPGNEPFQWISRHLLSSGLFWENKVARSVMEGKIRSLKHLSATDLKGLLLSLEKSLGSEKGKGSETESLLLQVREAIHWIEQDQFLNLSSLEEGLGWLWVIPGMEEEGFRRAEVFGEKREEGEGFYLSMFLEFTRLGDVEVGVSLEQSVIGVRIFLEDEEKAGFINRDLPLLESGLRDAGLTVGRMLCEVKGDHTPAGRPFAGRTGGAPSIHLVI
ncbi:MAG: hypothetical protein ABII06_22105 [Pseudomonadota bacterium]